jgi:hypothetical protein
VAWLPYTSLPICRLPTLGKAGLSLSESQTPAPPMGVSANVGPQDGPPEIGLEAARLLEKNGKKERSCTPCPYTPFVHGLLFWLLH